MEWRAARGELGGGEASTSGTPLKGERPARDEHVAALWASIDAMWAVAQADAAQRGIPSNDGMYSRLTLVLQTAKGLRALRWKERKLEVAEGKKVNGRELSAKGGAAYREALTAGGGGGLLEAVGFRVETDDVMLR